MLGTTSPLLLLAVAASFLVTLAGCHFRSAGTVPAVDLIPAPPGGEVSTAALPGVPANHGFEPMDRLTVPPGNAEVRENIEISCPVTGPACVLSVAVDGTLQYETSGGIPTIMVHRPTPERIVDLLKGMVRNSNSPALARHAARGPSPGQVTCKALTIDCEGGLGPVHHRSIPRFDFSGFEFLERHRGVSLARKMRLSTRGSDTFNHRALAGWLDHSFFLVATPGAQIAADEREAFDRYYTAYSIGDSTNSNPDVPVDGTAEWSGVMAGSRVSDPDMFIQGDASITVSNLASEDGPSVDVEFSNIRNEGTQSNIEDMSWRDLKLEGGSFGLAPIGSAASGLSRHPASIGISGRFYGPNHEEVGGLFGYSKKDPAGRRPSSNVIYSGAFGGKRN